MTEQLNEPECPMQMQIDHAEIARLRTIVAGHEADRDRVNAECAKVAEENARLHASAKITRNVAPIDWPEPNRRMFMVGLAILFGGFFVALAAGLYMVLSAP